MTHFYCAFLVFITGVLCWVWGFTKGENYDAFKAFADHDEQEAK